MNFVKYEPLKQRLRERAVSDREALPYLVASCVATALVTSFPMIENFNKWDVLSGVFSMIIAAGGVFYAYVNNGGRDGYDLIQKYVVLGWVVGVRCLLAFIPLIFLLVGVGDVLGFTDLEQTGWFDVLIISVFEIVVCQRIGRHIRDTRGEAGSGQ